MNDAAVRDLARRAGIAVEWTDYANRSRLVPIDAVRCILAALGVPCDTPGELSHSNHALKAPWLPPLITATVQRAIKLPIPRTDAPSRVRLTQDDGKVTELALHHAAQELCLPAVDTPGYHTLEIGQQRTTLAVAPARCITVSDLAPGERLWGPAAQIYGLRSPGDCGIGDMAGVVALARAAATAKADVLAISPVHALFAADPNHFSPYSPSSRLFYNPLHADASSLLGKARVATARRHPEVAAPADDLEACAQIDWTRSSRTKMSLFRRLFDDFATTELLTSPASTLAIDFARFCAAGGSALEQHALFEALHAARREADPEAKSWRDWPAEWRNPTSPAARRFAGENRHEILFHCFLQWVVDRSLAAAQQHARRAGMRIGLIADLAVGTNSGGSHCWTNQEDMLGGVEIGAPPDLFNTSGQNWGLTTFSPHALSQRAFAPYLATIRACLRHAGGIRIDHAMGLMRLWVIPRGAKASEGAYLAYPLDDLLRLTVLESYRHRAIVIGEDLGTVPAGFRDRLSAAGVYGMRVLWFERRGDRFAPPSAWPAEATAMTSTHDLPTVAGWWAGSDIEARARCGLVEDAESELAARGKHRRTLWRSLRAARVSGGALPPPNDGSRIVQAVVRFVAKTPCRLALLPLEDALALKDQPNLPGTIHQHPNWRRRYLGKASELLDRTVVRDRISPLAERTAP